jgi:hypothetical protein
MRDAVLLAGARDRRNTGKIKSNIMNQPIISAEAKARLTEAVKNYIPPAPEKYRALNEVKDSIIELRERKASYQTIRTILHESAGIDVSHQTIARYCRDVLDVGNAKKPRRPKTPPTEPPASAPTEPGAASTQTEPPSRPHIGYPRSRGPRITDSKNL